MPNVGMQKKRAVESKKRTGEMIVQWEDKLYFTQGSLRISNVRGSTTTCAKTDFYNFQFSKEMSEGRLHGNTSPLSPFPSPETAAKSPGISHARVGNPTPAYLINKSKLPVLSTHDWQLSKTLSRRKSLSQACFLRLFELEVPGNEFGTFSLQSIDSTTQSCSFQNRRVKYLVTGKI